MPEPKADWELLPSTRPTAYTALSENAANRQWPQSTIFARAITKPGIDEITPEGRSQRLQTHLLLSFKRDVKWMQLLVLRRCIAAMKPAMNCACGRSLTKTAILVLTALAAAGGGPSSFDCAAADKSYREIETSYTNRQDGVVLGATLTLPEGAGPFPAVLLITGMGPQDRDETIGPFKPFAVIADSFARHKVATLRVDDRGTGVSGGNWMSSYATYCQDVCRGLEYLKSRPEIDARQLGLLGHSEGGVIGAMVAAQANDVRFLIMLASPCVPAMDFVLRHNEAMLQRAHVTGEKLEKDLDGVRKLIQTLRDTNDPAQLKQKLLALISQKPQSAEETEREVAVYCTPWARDYMTSDVTKPLQTLRCPILALWGSKDVLVEPDQNVAGLRKLRNGVGEANTTIRVLPEMNHLFQKCQTGDVDEFFKLKGCMDPEVLEILTEWLSRHTKTS